MSDKTVKVKLVRAKNDVNGKKLARPGEVVTVDEQQAAELVKYGWGEIIEVLEQPAKTTKREKKVVKKSDIETKG